MISQVVLFPLVFWKNWRHQKVLSKLLSIVYWITLKKNHLFFILYARLSKALDFINCKMTTTNLVYHYTLERNVLLKANTLLSSICRSKWCLFFDKLFTFLPGCICHLIVKDLSTTSIQGISWTTNEDSWSIFVDGTVVVCTTGTYMWAYCFPNVCKLLCVWLKNHCFWKSQNINYSAFKLDFDDNLC